MKKIMILYLLLFSSCNHPDSKKRQVTHFEGIAMTIPYRMTIGKNLNDQEWHLVQDTVLTAFDNTHQTFDNWNLDSEISLLNTLSAYEVANISEEMYQFLLMVNQMYTLTEGRFDPAIGALKAIWKQTAINGEEPFINLNTNWHSIHFTESTFYKDNTAVQLDFCGIAKGYTIDQIVIALQEKGFADLFIEWGGEIRASGSYPDNRPWQVSLYPKNSLMNNPPKTIPLINQAIATSGDYLDRWPDQKNNTVCFHIINPGNHQPLQVTSHSITSVSVCASNCMIADALATAGMIFDSIDDAEDWARGVQRTLPETTFYFYQRNPDKLDSL